jgi:signal transduction histidine kinase
LNPFGRLGRTTAFRLAATQLAVFAILTAALIGWVAVRTSDLLTRQVDAVLATEIDQLGDAYQRGGLRLLALTVETRARRPGASLYLVADSAGRTLVGNIDEVPIAVLARADEEAALVSYTRIDDEGGATYQALARVVTLPGGFRLLVGRDISERTEFRDVVRDAALAAVAVMLATALASWFLVGRAALKRVDQMAGTARQIMSGDLHRRLEVTGSGDEFDNLADSLNAMLARIEALMSGLKEVSDNIAHDLKTPLTRLRTRLETVLRAPSGPEVMREAVEATIHEADQLIAVFDALLRIARVEAGAPGEARATFDAGALVAEVGELYQPVVEEAGGRLDVRAATPLPVSANRALVAQALTNLLDNAMKYGAGQGGAPPDLTLSVRAEGGEVRLVVTDRGPGIPAADRSRAVERFVRLDASRSRPGSGLGLSLVQAVAKLHGGRLDLADAGPGLVATLALPAAMSENGRAGTGGAGADDDRTGTKHDG